MAFDYANRDYATIRSDLLARASRVLPEWTDRDPGDFGMLMIDLWAYSADVMHYYIDRAAREAFLSTATQRESLLALADLFDYTPSKRTRSSGTVVVANSNSTAVSVPRYTNFVVEYDGTKYNAYNDSAVSVSASSTANVGVYEGTFISGEVLTSSSSGLTGQSYTLRYSGVVPDTVTLQVLEDGTNAKTYRKVNALSEYGSGDRVYVLAESADGYSIVRFGNGVSGYIPPTNSTIRVSYGTSNGSKGNFTANSVLGFSSSPSTHLSVISSTAFTGGQDDESIASLKQTVPSAISTQDRAVTLDDFINLAKKVPSVTKAHAEYSSGVVTVYPHVDRSSDYLTTTDTSQTVDANTLGAAVQDYLRPRALLGVTVNSAPSISWTKVDISATVNVNERYIRSWVEADVESALDELFKFDNVTFGQRLTLGQVYRTILDVEGVDYAVISVFGANTGTPPSTAATEINIDANKLPKKGTVSLVMAGGATV